jgi:hypothetical protein
MIRPKKLKMASNSTYPNTTEEVTSYESLETRYVRMIVESDEIPWKYNVLASAANWILLAGYLVVPGTFTSLQKSDTGWIEISFTTCTRRIYLEPSLETRYTYYSYSSPEPLSWL